MALARSSVGPIGPAGAVSRPASLSRNRRSDQRRWPRLALLVALVLTLTATATRPSAAADDPGGERVRDPRIVGGTEAPAGAWPSQAALLRRSMANDKRAFYCGGTVVAPSWVLTAAHCTMGFNANSIDVLTGRSDLDAAGGQRLHVAEIVNHPHWADDTMQSDISLLRLDQPTEAPPMTLVQQGQSSLWDAGSPVTATGWGRTDPGSDAVPARLRQVTVPMVSDSDCATAYPVGSEVDVFYADSMTCAGDLAAGGRDTCQGDSGGPLVAANPNGGWLQVGITSWGEGCALRNRPGVYTRLAAFTPWVAQTIRYGPFGSAVEFVDQQYADILGRPPTTSERNALVSRLDRGLTPQQAIAELVSGDTTNLSSGAIVRFYYGYFAGRDPDTSGFLYWIDQYRRGVSLNTIASAFSQSNEFQQRYGPLTNEQFVDLVYQNVLHRAPDPGGRAYWVDTLNRGHPRWAVMSLFTESIEHRDLTRSRVDRTVAHTVLLREAPNKTWLDFTVSLPFDAVVRSVLVNPAYARRF